MNQNTLKTILTVAALIFVFGIAMSILKWLIGLLLPISIVVIAAYIIYKFAKRSKF